MSDFVHIYFLVLVSSHIFDVDPSINMIETKQKNQAFQI